MLSNFDLTQAEADEFPEVVPIRDQLNLSIAYLSQSAQTWDAICANPAGSVPPPEANTGYLAAQNAQSALEQARAAYSAWNP